MCLIGLAFLGYRLAGDWDDRAWTMIPRYPSPAPHPTSSTLDSVSIRSASRGLLDENLYR